MKIIHSARKADAQYIHDRLYAYNCSKTGETPKKIVLPDEPAMHSFIIPAEHSDEILGGLVYHVKESACKVDFLWVSETLRGQGAGMKLLFSSARLLPESGICPDPYKGGQISDRLLLSI